MEKKNLDWANLGFGYIQTEYRYVCRYKDGQWDEGGIETEANITLNECACVFQYCQACFEGLKAYYTKDGRIVTFRPDLNAQRMADTCARLEMPAFPVDKFVEAVKAVVAANADYVPPYGTGASLYLRPRHRREPVPAPLHDRHQPGHRRQARHGVRVPHLRHPRGPLLQGRREAHQPDRLRL